MKSVSGTVGVRSEEGVYFCAELSDFQVRQVNLEQSEFAPFSCEPTAEHTLERHGVFIRVIQIEYASDNVEFQISVSGGALIAHSLEPTGEEK